MGARVVPNSMASWTAPLETEECITKLPRTTPAMMGTMLPACFPKAEKPTIVRTPPPVGPFRSPPVSRITPIAINPLTPMLISTGAAPNMRR